MSVVSLGLIERRTLCHLWEWIGCILSPEEIFTFKIISLPRCLAVGSRLHRNAIEFNGQNVRNKRLILALTLLVFRGGTVQLWEIMGIRSKLRSRMTMTGLS